MNTLTADKAALYFGAKVLLPDGNIAEVDRLIMFVLFDGRPSKLKLLLRTVEQLTDEELVKICEFSEVSQNYLKEEYGYQYNSLTHVDIGRRISGDFINDYGDPIRISPENAKKAADYLRSIGIDIDNAILEGWAVEAKEVAS